MGLFGGACKKELIEKENEIRKLMQMLDNVDNVVMLCDTTSDNKIFYMNRKAKELMQQHRSDLNSGLRGADVANAAGNSIHQYHKDPNRIRRIFADPRGSHAPLCGHPHRQYNPADQGLPYLGLQRQQQGTLFHGLLERHNR